MDTLTNDLHGLTLEEKKDVTRRSKTKKNDLKSNDIPEKNKTRKDELKQKREKQEGQSVRGKNKKSLEAIPEITKTDDHKTNDIPKVITDIKLDKKATFDLLPYQVTAEQASNLEKATRSQASSKIWKAHHKGRITTSLFGRVYSSRTGHESLVSQIMGYSQVPDHLRSITWGRDNEDKARLAFIEYEAKNHKEFVVKPCGLIVDPERPHLGSTPDGIVECACCPPASLEIKCPYSARFKTIDEWFNHPSCYLNKGRTLKKSHTYYSQIQGQMAICHLTRTYFVIYTTKDMHVEIVEFDKEYWAELEKKLKSFYESQILPELQNKSLQQKLNRVKDSCTCKGKEKGVVITCKKCEKNFHLKCVQLRRKPKQDWLCTVCVGSNCTTNDISPIK